MFRFYLKIFWQIGNYTITFIHRPQFKGEETVHCFFSNTYSCHIKGSFQHSIRLNDLNLTERICVTLNLFRKLIFCLNCNVYFYLEVILLKSWMSICQIPHETPISELYHNSLVINHHPSGEGLVTLQPKHYSISKQVNLGLLLSTWFNFNPDVDK